MYGKKIPTWTLTLYFSTAPLRDVVATVAGYLIDENLFSFNRK